jgi:hypothetical protein
VKHLIQIVSFEVRRQYKGDGMDRRDERIVNERIESRRGKRGGFDFYGDIRSR